MPVCLCLPYISSFITVLIAGTTRPSSSIPSGHSTLSLSISSWVHDMPSLFFLNSVQITLSLEICHHPYFLNDPTTATSCPSSNPLKTNSYQASHLTSGMLSSTATARKYIHTHSHNIHINTGVYAYNIIEKFAHAGSTSNCLLLISFSTL